MIPCRCSFPAQRSPARSRKPAGNRRPIGANTPFEPPFIHHKELLQVLLASAQGPAQAGKAANGGVSAGDGRFFAGMGDKLRIFGTAEAPRADS